jgi:hypothetical protein
METISLQNNAYAYAVSGESIFDKIVKAYKENRATVICGMMALNGSTNVYPIYKMLSK